MQEIIDFGEAILAGTMKSDFPEYEMAQVRIVGETAIVPIYGTITQRANLFTRVSGGTSTQVLEATLKRMEVDDRIKTIVLDIDSPGGTVPGVANVAAVLRRIRENKNVIAVANETMASGAYWIGSAANKIYLGSPTADVGSIGVYSVIQDSSKALEDKGIKLHLVKRGEFKGGGADGKIDEKVLSELQRRIDSTYNQFVKEISLNRNITMDEAQDMATGQMHAGQAAVEAGFADGIKTLDEVIAEINDVTELRSMIVAKEKELAESVAEVNNMALEITELLEENESLMKQIDELEAQISDFEAEKLIMEFETKIPAQKKEEWINRVKTLGVEETREILASLNDVVSLGEEVVEAVETFDNGNVAIADSPDAAKIYEKYNIPHIKKF